MKYSELQFERYCPVDDQVAQKDSFQALAREVALGISYNGLNHAVMMATPEDLEDFALGFSFTSGAIEQRDQLLDVEITEVEEGVLLDITLNQRALSRLKQQRRNLTGSSGCGLCGVEALSQALALDRESDETLSCDFFPPLPPLLHFEQLRERFHSAQKYRQTSGALHCALYVDESGETRLYREDIGRHNALDKLIGACLAEGLDLQPGFVAITSRCGLELIQKCVRAGVGTLVSLSSPSDISVHWARRHQLNLLHQLAGDMPRIYSGSDIQE